MCVCCRSFCIIPNHSCSHRDCHICNCNALKYWNGAFSFYYIELLSRLLFTVLSLVLKIRIMCLFISGFRLFDFCLFVCLLYVFIKHQWCPFFKYGIARFFKFYIVPVSARGPERGGSLILNGARSPSGPPQWHVNSLEIKEKNYILLSIGWCLEAEAELSHEWNVFVL